MSDAYADAVLAFEDAVHKAATRAEESLTQDEIAKLLHELAAGYERGDFRD